LKRESFNVFKKLHGYSMEFDSKGNLIKDTKFKNGVLVLFNTHEYDKNSRIVQMNRFAGKDRLLSYKVFKYNTRGSLVEHINYSAEGKIKSKVESEYNSKRNRIAARYYEGTPRGKTKLLFYKIFQFSKGNLIRVATYNAANKMLGSGIYDYDVKGNKTRQKYFDHRGKLMGFSTYSYEGL
jgi:antitoxin component YwqK of YwqJK toxin-antitoxin module